MNNALNPNGAALEAKQDQIISMHSHLNARRNILSLRESGGHRRYTTALGFEFVDE